jgi:hypothetical protein
MRYRFGPTLLHALQVRGLEMRRVAELARVSPTTVSAAVRGRSVNMTTATRIARVVAACPVIDELVEWSEHSGHLQESGT